MRNPLTLSMLAAATVWLVAASPAAASCALPPGAEDHLAMADAVFVGTVVELSNADRTAVVTVEEIWHGPPLDASVTVHGGPDDPNAATSVDRSFVSGARYLFAVYISEGTLHDNSCSATQEWTEELVALRPSDAAEPSPKGESDGLGSLPMGPIAVGVAVLLVIGTSLLAFRTRR